jgi:hypothetical protein
MDEVENFFFANFQILGPLGRQGWVLIPQNVGKIQNHCTLLDIQVQDKCISTTAAAHTYYSKGTKDKHQVKCLTSVIINN